MPYGLFLKLTRFDSFLPLEGGWKTGSFRDLFSYALSVLSKSESVYVLLFCLRIWQARNDEIFQCKYIPITVLFIQISLLLKNGVQYIVGLIPLEV